MADKINLLVDIDRMTEHLTIGDYLGMQEGDVEGQVAVLSKFVSDGNGEYLTPEEGRKVILKIPLFALKDVLTDFMEMVTDAVSPPVSGNA